MSKSFSSSKSGIARVLAGLGLWLIVTAAMADDAAKPTPPAAPATAVTTATDPKPAVSVICVNAVQCFSAKAATASISGQKPLDLRAPDIRRVFSEAELQQKIPDPVQEREIQEEVQVEGQRQMAPVSVGLLAIPWAIMHPTQAWRILTPMTDAK